MIRKLHNVATEGNPPNSDWNPVIFMRFIGLLFIRELIRGDKAQKRRFYNRVTRRALHYTGLQPLSELLFGLRRKFSWRLGSRWTNPAWHRYRLWDRATSGLANRDYLWSWVTDASREEPRFIVLGIGSIGDILQMTPALRALKDRVPSARICVLHSCPAVTSVLQGNPYIESAAWAPLPRLLQILSAVRIEGAAQVAIAIQYAVRYVLPEQPTATVNLNNVLPKEFFVQAQANLEPWALHFASFPGDIRQISRLAEARNLHYLDLMGVTGNLPINRQSEISFYPRPGDESILSLIPDVASMITINSGVDADVMNWALASGRRATKLLPLGIWKATVELLRSWGYTVVQLGTRIEEPVDGVSVDLRGRTSLFEASIILKHARCHVGAEGGLVHIARAMKTRAVALFGPTSKAFLGYPDNINMTACDCSNCWHTTKDWFMSCPRGLHEPQCMTTYTAEAIASSARRLALEARPSTITAGRL